MGGRGVRAWVMGHRNRSGGRSALPLAGSMPAAGLLPAAAGAGGAVGAGVDAGCAAGGWLAVLGPCCCCDDGEGCCNRGGGCCAAAEPPAGAAAASALSTYAEERSSQGGPWRAADRALLAGTGGSPARARLCGMRQIGCKAPQQDRQYLRRWRQREDVLQPSKAGRRGRPQQAQPDHLCSSTGGAGLVLAVVGPRSPGSASRRSITHAHCAGSKDSQLRCARPDRQGAAWSMQTCQQPCRPCSALACRHSHLCTGQAPPEAPHRRTAPPAPPCSGGAWLPSSMCGQETGSCLQAAGRASALPAPVPLSGPAVQLRLVSRDPAGAVRKGDHQQGASEGRTPAPLGQGVVELLHEVKGPVPQADDHDGQGQLTARTQASRSAQPDRSPQSCAGGSGCTRAWSVAQPPGLTQAG